MAAPVLFRGAELLVLEPTLVDGAPRRDALALPGDVLRAPWAGDVAAAVRASGAPPAGTTAYTWVCESRAALADVAAFLARRAGRLIGCWLPTFRPDVTVTAAAPGVTSVTIRAADYAAATWPLFAALARADALGIWSPDGTAAGAYRVAAITGATANGDGTETLALATGAVVGAGAALSSAQGGVASFVRYARLAEDRVTITHWSGSVAVVTAAFQTLPRETPA
jgi:hypothetical protein